MATWGVHLRVASRFLNKIDKQYYREFVIGNVAPDCGYGEKDSFGDFVPPPSITHWSPSGMKCDCRYKDFYDEYLTDNRNIDYWFYLGYYVHLLVDIMWSATIYAPTKVKYVHEYEENPEFLKIIKRDWNDIDFKYFTEHEEHTAFDILSSVKQVKDYLPYYEENQLTKQIKVIVEYYKNYSGNINREFKYTTPDELQNFVDCAVEIVELVLEKEKLL